MTEAMPFLRKLITFLWPPVIGRGLFAYKTIQEARCSVGSVWLRNSSEMHQSAARPTRP